MGVFGGEVDGEVSEGLGVEECEGSEELGVGEYDVSEVLDIGECEVWDGVLGV